MITLIYILLGITLSCIAYQDLKNFRVSIVHYILSVIFCSIIGICTIDKYSWLKFIAVNLSIIIVQSGILLAYLYVRNRGKKGLFSFIGKGDLFFFVTIALSFSPINFVIFQLCSFLIILLVHFVLRKLKYIGGFVPLAGYQAIMLLTVLITSIVLKSYSRFDDSSFLKLLI